MWVKLRLGVPLDLTQLCLQQQPKETGLPKWEPTKNVTHRKCYDEIVILASQISRLSIRQAMFSNLR